MKKFIKGLLREVLLREVYGKAIIKSVANRFGVSENDEELLNKLAIASIYRNVFGDINKYQTKESFADVYNKWYENTINELIKTSAFVSNKELATKYLDAYVSNIKSVSGNVQPFSMKKIEQGLVDLVNNSGWIKDKGIDDTHSIYKPNSEDVVYEDDNIIILNTDTKAKCVMYGKGERWCITKPELNYYNTYRLNYGATPYFVLQKKIKDSDNEHKLVIMNYGKKGYAIADRSNSGKRHGGLDLAMPWVNIEGEIPNLRGKEEYFPYRAVTEDEKEYNTLLIKIRDNYIGNNLQGLIDDKINGLVINGSQVTAEDFIRDYAATGVIMSVEQLASLRDSLKDSLIESGYFIRLNEDNFIEIKNVLNNKQILRNIRLKLNNDINLNWFEVMLLSDKERYEYINMANDRELTELFSECPEPSKFYDALGKYSKEFFVRLIDSPKGVANLLEFSKNKDWFIDKITNDKTLRDGLSPYKIFWLLKYSSKPYDMFNLLSSLDNKVYFNYKGNEIDELILKSINRRDIIKLLISSEENISILNDYNIDNMLRISKPDVRDSIISALLSSPVFLSQSNIKQITSLIMYLDDNEYIFDYLQKSGLLIKKLYGATPDEIKRLISFSSNNIKIVNLILNTDLLVKKQSGELIESILEDSDDPIRVIDILLAKDGFIDNLDEYGISAIIAKTNQNTVEDVYNKLLSSKQLLSKMNNNLINTFLFNIANKDIVIDKILDSKEVIDKLDNYRLFNLFLATKNPENVINKLGDKGLSFMNKLDSDAVETLLKSSKAPDKMKALLNRYGKA